MDYDLRKLQLTIMIIAKEIKRICEKNGIKYTIYAGTVLGAVRHGGFIPWDDDVDFAMTRENYNRFIECCKRELDSRFTVVDWDSDEEYTNFFLKVMLRGTKAITKGNKNTSYYKGIYVDVFPLDNIPRGKIRRFFQRVVSRFLLRLIAHKENYNWEGIFTGTKKIMNDALGYLARLLNRKAMISACERLMTKYNGTKSDYYACVCGTYGCVKETYPRNWIDETVRLDFEGESFMCIGHTKEYLTQIYGNYMQLPPVEKRHSHSFVDVDFGCY